MKSIRLTIIFLSFIFLLDVLTAQYQLVKKIQVKGAMQVTTDPTGNAYLSFGNEMWMFNRSDSLYRKYSNIQLGEIAHIDATNPMKILLYYKDQGKIQFLDNNISEFIQPVVLENYDMGQATVACTSYDNGFWIYNPSTFSLIRFDQNFKISTTISNINQILQVDELNPVMAQEFSNRIYLSDPQLGIIVFDVFGGYYKTIPLTNVNNFQVIENKLIYLQSKSIYSYDLINMNEEKFEIPEEILPVSVSLNYNKLYVLTKDLLYIYKTM